MISRFVNLTLERSSIIRPVRTICTAGSTFSSTKLQLINCCSSQPNLPAGQYRTLLLSSLARQYSAQTKGVFFAPPKPLEIQREGASEVRAKNGTITSVDGVHVDAENKQLIVSWRSGDSRVFPFVWLRDNCRCPQCFHPVALARLTQAHQLNIDISASSAGISPDGERVIIEWEDGHESQFPFDWLREYSFSSSPDDQLLNPKPSLWGADIVLQRFDFSELLEDDQALYNWLADLVARGIAVVKNTPREVGQLHRLGQRVSFLRSTNYGPTFHVKSKLDPSNAAYTSGALALHTDLAYYIRQPGIQMLHCIEQAECTGGENLFSDGFKVAMDLKQVDPEAFRLLTTAQFEFFDAGKDHYGDFHQHARHPTIELNEEGEIESVCISDHSRDPMLRIPLDQVLPVYRALHKYCNMLVHPDNLLKYKMEKGDIMTFNNRRALHGRSGFRVTKASGRHLEGGYLEWDDVNSRLRVLARQLQNQTESQ